VINPTIVISQKKSAGVSVSDSATVATDGNIIYYYITVNLTEPFLFLSPSSGFTPSKNDAAMHGINNINIVANIRSNLTGMYKSTASSGYTKTVSLGKDGDTAVTSLKLLINLLTLQPEQYSRINTRNMLPIQDYSRFVSSYNSTVLAGATNTFTSPIVSLNQIPETLLVFVLPTADATYFSSMSSYLTINSATISLNNQSGILASCSQQELYNISNANGSKQSYTDFIGLLRFNEQIVSGQGSFFWS